MKHLVMGILMMAAACGSASKATTTPGGADEGPATAVDAAATGTLRALDAGDTACSVTIETPDGEVMMPAGFELCPGGERDATALIGQAVTWTTEKGNVLAAECEGDMDCGKSDEVELIVTLTAAP
jgi:hypothetical protein